MMMGEMTDTEAALQGADRVGFRDIYRAVGESETRIKEHISLVLLPLTTQMADHETRIRSIEEKGSDEARAAVAATEALESRVTTVEAWQANVTSAGIERRRLGSLTNKALAALILGSNFVIGVVILIANFLTSHPMPQP